MGASLPKFTTSPALPAQLHVSCTLPHMHTSTMPLPTPRVLVAAGPALEWLLPCYTLQTAPGCLFLLVPDQHCTALPCVWHRAFTLSPFPAHSKEEMRLEVAASDNVELNTNVLKACKDERSLFCRRVSTGQARVFRCLVENMGSADFGDTCKMVIMTKLVRRQANWRLDPPLRRACRENVAK